MRFKIIEEQSHVLQYVIEAVDEEDATKKWLASNGDGFEFKDLDEYFTYYEVQGKTNDKK
jgi:hypothetical protein